MTQLVNISVSLLPVLFFLSVLIVMDSYKLVPLRSILRTILVGFLVALLCYYLNVWLLGKLSIDFTSYTRYVAPITEEPFKALYIVFLIRAKRVGFMVDAAIFGFALGAGFAIVENVFYLQTSAESSVIGWIARGFGTAIMHGSTTAIFAILAKSFSDRYPSSRLRVLLPGLGIAMLTHSVFNHSTENVFIFTGIQLIVLPLLIIVVFERSEKATKNWLGVGFDSDAELLELILSGEITQTKIGRYLESLRATFPGPVVADMLCLLRIHVELAIRAKGMLLAREAGLNIELDSEVQESFEELKYLEKSIGPTGKLAILPFLKTSSRDLWQLYMLGK